MPLSFATGPSHNHVARQPIKSNLDENNYPWQQMLNERYSMMSVNREATICGLVSTVIDQWLSRCYA